MSELVFETLRVGFPTAEVEVWFNGEIGKVEQMAGNVKFRQVNTIHHEWINKLIAEENEPFWICDTDMIFYASVEGFTTNKALMGMFIPEFHDEFSGALTRSRLHTSLLRIDPGLVRDAVEFMECRATKFTPSPNLVNPMLVFQDRKRIFNDTCSLLYHTVGGESFTNEQKDAYFHFHFGTISDLVLPKLSDREALEAGRAAVLEDPEKGRGLWREQEKYFAARAPVVAARDLPAAIAVMWDKRKIYNPVGETVKESSQVQQADKLALLKQVCNGDEDAVRFLSAWQIYVNAIDDIVDGDVPRRAACRSHGMANELYSCPFYRKHEARLQLLVQLITCAYQDSEELIEKTVNLPREYALQLSDVLRHAGAEMVRAVAYLTGGWNNLRKWSMKTHEVCYHEHHDAKGNPT
jgi:hypothetical protein